MNRFPVSYIASLYLGSRLPTVSIRYYIYIMPVTGVEKESGYKKNREKECLYLY